VIKKISVLLIGFFIGYQAIAQTVQLSNDKLVILSPNQKLSVALCNKDNSTTGEWYLKINSIKDGTSSELIHSIRLGIAREDQDYLSALKFIKASKPKKIVEDYIAIHGKRSHCTNDANEVTVNFINPDKSKMNIIVRAYNDGIVFRYEFPDKTGKYIINDEYTAYEINPTAKRWMEKWVTSNENLYSTMSDDKVQQEWGYPALFKNQNNDNWFLIHEADLDKNYCGTKLSNKASAASYKLTFPDQRDAKNIGESKPTINLPWKSPWRVIIAGSLSDIVESTLIDDVSTPSKLEKTDWIQPGIVSWNYWSSNHGTKDYKIVCAFADLAVDMGWPYTLLDWEWDAMGNGGNLEDATKYIISKGIKPLIWYNSGGEHSWTNATPKDRMLTHENRVAEFTKLQKLGIKGVKIDFFESEKQDMINYYLDVLEDAAKFDMMVYFHGCLVPRGWARTYPNLMTHEGIRGAEWYNNGSEFTYTAPEHNTIVPFTRNVIGSMDYTPVTFTNSQNPHITSYGHELALSVVFESGLQHFADRPSGYYELPEAPKEFLKKIPAAWDNTKLVDGYPGKDLIMARQKGDKWYLGGINGENREKYKKVPLTFLSEGNKYSMTIIKDGEHDKTFETQKLSVDNKTVLDVKMLRRGGFAASFTVSE
jgi:hypothetical protein